MEQLVKKTARGWALKLDFIARALLMVAAIVMLPVGIGITDVTLLKNPYILAVIGAGMLFFAMVGYFFCVRPYRIYCRTPEVQLESDGEFLYIHTKKEAKIPISELSNVTIYSYLPYLYQKEFLEEILVHLASDAYGQIHLSVPGYGTYKMLYVAQVKKTAKELENYINRVTNCA